jgi:hypothetical protein
MCDSPQCPAACIWVGLMYVIAGVDIRDVQWHLLKDTIRKVESDFGEGLLRSWSDATSLVEEHDPHCVREGEEGLEVDIFSDGSGESDGEDQDYIVNCAQCASIYLRRCVNTCCM